SLGPNGPSPCLTRAPLQMQQVYLPGSGRRGGTHRRRVDGSDCAGPIRAGSGQVRGQRAEQQAHAGAIVTTMGTIITDITTITIVTIAGGSGVPATALASLTAPGRARSLC